VTNDSQEKKVQKNEGRKRQAMEVNKSGWPKKA